MTALDHNAGETQPGKGLALPGLIIGLIAGILVYAITEFWIDDVDGKALPVTALFFVVTATAAYLLLVESRHFMRPALGALAIAVLMAGPDYFLTQAAGDDNANISQFPLIFWFALSRSLVAYLLVTIVKAMLEDGAPPPYRSVFFHGLTIPLIAGGAKVIAGLALILLFVWARLLKELDVNFFNELFQEPWFLFPFLGAIGGLSIAMMRGQQAVLGALRMILLVLCRILMPITAALTITFFVILATKGVHPVFDLPLPGAWMTGTALLGMLIFNGVYQNGEGNPPPAWLRISTIITLVGFPVYALLAFYAFWLRIGDYGITPPRIAGLTVAFLAAAYSIVCIAGLLTELNWKSKRWMPLVAPLNTAMAILWILVLALQATPFFNPWAISAKSQYDLLAQEKIAPEDFDFGYLRFQLGAHGERTLSELSELSTHPELEAIRDGVERARDAKNQWEYDNPDFAAPEPAVIERENTDPDNPGPEDLPLNPQIPDAEDQSGDLDENG